MKYLKENQTNLILWSIWKSIRQNSNTLDRSERVGGYLDWSQIVPSRLEPDWFQFARGSIALCAVERARVLLIGANKGFDCIGWLRFFSRGHGDLHNIRHATAKEWLRQLAVARNVRPNEIDCGVCGQCRDDYPVVDHVLSKSPPQVHCIEAMPGNANILKKAAAAANLPGLTFQMAAATIGADGRGKETVSFLTKGRGFGDEDKGINSAASYELVAH